MPDVNMSVFEEVKRNQLVTEIDIQTQVALDDYQVQLSNIANPTQSQDNVVIDRHGEFLSHWNESLDFDTWVKMSMETAGKRILMLRGNSSVSDRSFIDGVFIFGDDFNGISLDSSKWDTLGATLSFDGNTISVKNNSDSTDQTVSSKTTFTGEYILESRAKIIGTAAYNYLLKQSDTPTDNTPSTIIGTSTAVSSPYKCYINYGASTHTATPTSNDFSIFARHKIIRLDSSVKYYYNNAHQITHTTNIPTSTDSLVVGFMPYYLNEEIITDNIFVRKYTATEPTTNIGTPKNIAIALKSLGRAG